MSVWDVTSASDLSSEELLRVMLWQRHGCAIANLRDDGYCKRCGIHFALRSASEIWDAFENLRRGARPIK